MVKKVALGKGLASLIPTNPADFISADINGSSRSEVVVDNSLKESGPVMIDISSIITNKDQPRKIFKEKELQELTESIIENGIIQPLIVTKVEKGFELIAGERRYRAAKRANLSKVPVVIKQVTDREKKIISIIENVQRDDLNCVEEALAYYQLMDEYKLTQEDVAKKLGKDRSTVANFLRLLKLPRAVVDLLQKEILSFGHGKVLAAVKEPEAVLRLANVAVAESLSVRELEKLINTKKKPLSDRPKPLGIDMSAFKDHFEKKTGFHFDVKSKKPGVGEIMIKFGNEAEFNDIYEYLMKR